MSSSIGFANGDGNNHHDSMHRLDLQACSSAGASKREQLFEKVIKMVPATENEREQLKRAWNRLQTAALRGGLAGLGIRGGLHLVSALLWALRNPKARSKGTKRALSAAEILSDTVRYTVFLASLGGSFVAVDEGLAILLGKERTKNWRSIVAGAVAGHTILFTGHKTKHHSLATYVLLRGLTLLIRCGNKDQISDDAVTSTTSSSAFANRRYDSNTNMYTSNTNTNTGFRKLIRAILAPTRWQHGDVVLMCLCASQIIYSYIMMPGTLPPSYTRFIAKQTAKQPYVWQAVREQAVQNWRGHGPARLQTLQGTKWKDHCGHTPCEFWHPGQTCGGHALSVIPRSYFRSLGVYIPVYLVPAALVHRQKLLQQPLPILPKLLMGICRSALFLTSFIALAFGGACAGFNITGTSTGPVIAASTAVGGLAVLLEKKSRRMELALYCTSRALESFAMCLKEWKVLPSGVLPARTDVLLFAVGCAAIMHCYSDSKGRHRDVFKSKYLNVLDFVFGNTGVDKGCISHQPSNMDLLTNIVNKHLRPGTTPSNKFRSTPNLLTHLDGASAFGASSTGHINNHNGSWHSNLAGQRHDDNNNSSGSSSRSHAAVSSSLLSGHRWQPSGSCSAIHEDVLNEGRRSFDTGLHSSASHSSNTLMYSVRRNVSLADLEHALMDREAAAAAAQQQRMDSHGSNASSTGQYHHHSQQDLFEQRVHGGASEANDNIGMAHSVGSTGVAHAVQSAPEVEQEEAVHGSSNLLSILVAPGSISGEAQVTDGVDAVARAISAGSSLGSAHQNQNGSHSMLHDVTSTSSSSPRGSSTSSSLTSLPACNVLNSSGAVHGFAGAASALHTVDSPGAHSSMTANGGSSSGRVSPGRVRVVHAHMDAVAHPGPPAFSSTLSRMHGTVRVQTGPSVSSTVRMSGTHDTVPMTNGDGIVSPIQTNSSEHAGRRSVSLPFPPGMAPFSSMDMMMHNSNNNKHTQARNVNTSEPYGPQDVAALSQFGAADVVTHSVAGGSAHVNRQGSNSLNDISFRSWSKFQAIMTTQQQQQSSQAATSSSSMSHNPSEGASGSPEVSKHGFSRHSLEACSTAAAESVSSGSASPRVVRHALEVVDEDSAMSSEDLAALPARGDDGSCNGDADMPSRSGSGKLRQSISLGRGGLGSPVVQADHNTVEDEPLTVLQCENGNDGKRGEQNDDEATQLVGSVEQGMPTNVTSGSQVNATSCEVSFGIQHRTSHESGGDDLVAERKQQEACGAHHASTAAGAGAQGATAQPAGSVKSASGSHKKKNRAKRK